MSDETKDETKVGPDIFSAAFFAALTGVAGRSAGQDPGAVVNEAFVLAQRAEERFSTGQPVATDAERAQARAQAAQDILDGKVPATAAGVVVSGNAMQVGGRFQRPGAVAP